MPSIYYQSLATGGVKGCVGTGGRLRGAWRWWSARVKSYVVPILDENEISRFPRSWVQWQDSLVRKCNVKSYQIRGIEDARWKLTLVSSVHVATLGFHVYPKRRSGLVGTWFSHLKAK